MSNAKKTGYTTPPYSIDQTLNRLEEAMHHFLDSPVKGDFMSLTRYWRKILEGLTDTPAISPTSDEAYRDCDCAPCRIRAASVHDEITGERSTGTTIFINGEKHFVMSPQITYSAVAALAAGPDGWPAGSVLTMTHSGGGLPSGHLGVCGAVWVREGMIFDVADTSRA